MEQEENIQTSTFAEGRTYYDLEKKMSFADKRYLPRWSFANDISYHLDQETDHHKCQSRDLSSVGICLETQELLPLNSKLQLTVHLSEKNFFPAVGRVMWTRPTNSGYLSGIHFDRIKPNDQEMILQFAFEVKRQDVVNHWFGGWKQ